VEFSHRGKGINNQIMNKLLSWSESQGANDFYLDVYSKNESAIKAYQKAGFEPCMIQMKISKNKKLKK
ncbi:MAG: GNAT family N-acetyltransferase, partial [Saccharospirillaceae bacterium]|nr:GNAT family N-acetyltransferase [Saccharospirillaceae bacterium]